MSDESKPESADICTCNTLAEIAALPPTAIVTTSAMIRALGAADERVIKRKVRNGELPPPFKWGKQRQVWLARSIAEHFERLAKRACDAAAEKDRTLRRHLA